MYINSLILRDLRSLKLAEIDFRTPTDSERDPAVVPNVTLLLGDNGSGKTTILRAIALAVLGPVLPESGFVPQNLVRRVGKSTRPQAHTEAEMVLHWQDLGRKRPSADSLQLKLETTIRRVRDLERVERTRMDAPQLQEMYSDRSPAFLLVGYGAARRVESSQTYDSSLRGKSRLVRYQRVASLFEEQVTLIPLVSWLPKYQRGNPGRYKQVTDLLRALLPAECRFTGRVERGEYLFAYRGTPVPFSALSDGYRAYLAWISDLLYHVCMGCPSGVKLTENRGIVLIDEIDLHLHPEWQRDVVPRLNSALPLLQFVITSHSPIVTGTLESTNIIVLQPSSNGAIARRLTERVHGLNAEQILRSSYFGLETTRAKGSVNILRTLARRAFEGDQHAAIEYVKHLHAGLTTDETTPSPTDQRTTSHLKSRARARTKVTSEVDAAENPPNTKTGIVNPPRSRSKSAAPQSKTNNSRKGK